MKRLLAACRYVCGSLATITVVTSALLVTAVTNALSVNFDMRRQVVNLIGILNVTDCTGQVTRGGFTRMLVNVSSYRENLPSSNVSVFADVPGAHPDAVYIRIVASQGWITGFLGGLFKSEEYITYKDAMEIALTVLGYSNEDFTGDLASSHILKFSYLELNEEMNRQPEEVLNQTGCMSLFYNLSKTKKKNSSEIYGAALDCELNSSEEINPIATLDDERKGPILVRKGSGIVQSVSFGLENANVFSNRTANTLEAVKVSQQGAGFVVVYYNVKSKTIWAYTTRGWDDDDPKGNNAYVLLKGEVESIYYKPTDAMAPTSVRLEIDDDNSDEGFGKDGIDGDVYLTINLNPSELQYLFSIYDDIEVGDEVVMVYNKSGSSYAVIDATEYQG